MAKKKTPDRAVQRIIDAVPALRQQLADITDEIGQATAELAVGNLYVRDTGDLLRIRQLLEIPVKQIADRFTDGGKKWLLDHDVFTNEAGEEIIIHVLTDTKWFSKTRWHADDNGWQKDQEDYCLYSKPFAKEYGHARLVKAEAEYEAELQGFMQSKDLTPYRAAGPRADDDDEQGLLHVGSKQHLAAVAHTMQAQRNHVTVMQRLLKAELEKQKTALEAMRHGLNAIVADFQKKLKRIYRVIHTIELYLGIEEEIVQIQEGESAPVDTPISFRQLVTFMDEEMGLIGNGDGLDWQDIPLFDAWLTENENYKRLLPEEKGVAVSRVRRYNKVYVRGDDYASRHYNEKMNLPNHKTYILIRNGSNIYRIWADIDIMPRLFPRRTELQDLRDEVEKALESGRGNPQERQEEVEKIMHTYKARVILMQGLIDRTTLLHPLPQTINLFHLEDAQHLVNFVYDDDLLLPDGRLRFAEWCEDINRGITRGSRIILSGRWTRGDSWVSSKDFKSRFLRDYNDYNVPRLPSPGLYSVENVAGHEVKYGHYYPDEDSTEPKEFKIEYRWTRERAVKDENGKDKVFRTEPKLFIRYNPGGEVRSGWGDWSGHERKNNVSFEIRRDDFFVLNYDRIGLDDIDFYLESRLDRVNYLDMLPLLRHLKERRLNEMAWERDFVKLVQGQLLQRFGNALAGVDTEAVVWEAVEWWKHKVIWKRPITKDDAKALRMIEARAAKRFE